MAELNNEPIRGAALVVGVSDYRQAEIGNLAYAGSDASEVAKVLALPELCGFPASHVKLLTDKEANRDTIVEHLTTWLPAHSDNAGIALFYFAGHGISHPFGQREEGYLLPHDVDPANIAVRGIRMSEVAMWVEAVNARAFVILLDCCHAGRILPPGASLRSVQGHSDLKPSQLASLAGHGRFVIASCSEGQKSIEDNVKKHGLFTYHLLKGIRGAADIDRDGRVDMAELFKYVRKSVAYDAAKRFKLQQEPWLDGRISEDVYLSTLVAGTDATKIDGPGGLRLAVGESLTDSQRRQFEERFELASASGRLSLLKFIERIKSPAAIPIVFRCLADPDEGMREEARKAIRSFEWQDVVAAAMESARKGLEDHIDYILEGSAALRPHAEVVSLLDGLVENLKGSARNRCILLHEQKQRGLEMEELRALFQERDKRFDLQKVLGTGLLTTAYLAWDAAARRNVVLRVLRSDLAAKPGIRADFLSMSRMSIDMVHESLLITRETHEFKDSHTFFTVRDYLDGVTAREVLDTRTRLQSIDVIKIARVILNALQVIHGNEKYHGGVKTSNIFFGSRDRVFLGEPSLPLVTLEVEKQRLAYDYRYMAPEAFQRPAAIGPQFDLYSLGCVVYELLTGTPPFVADSHTLIPAMHVRDRHEPVSKRCPEVGNCWDEFLHALLEKAPSSRCQTAVAALSLLDDVARCLERRPDRLGDSGLPHTPPYVPIAPVVGDVARPSLSGVDPAYDHAVGDVVREYLRGLAVGERVNIDAFFSRVPPEQRALLRKAISEAGNRYSQGEDVTAHLSDFLKQMGLGGPTREATKQRRATETSISYFNEALLSKYKPCRSVVDLATREFSVGNEQVTPSLSETVYSVSIICPHCHHKFVIENSAGSDRVQCPSCGDNFSFRDERKRDDFAPVFGAPEGFQILQQLGVGGFGAVWKALDTRLHRDVAIKVPRMGLMDRHAQERFLREARAAAQLRHPNIMTIYEIGSQNDSPYIISEFIRGKTLGELTKSELQSPKSAAALVSKIAGALHHAHERGVIHRDIKPSNIMIDERGEPIVMDFGLAQRDSGDASVTREGAVMGTPAYMSPEQARGDSRDVTPSSDVYSLGVILYELLTGQLPFRGTAEDMMRQLAYVDPASPRMLNRSIPKDLETITLKCMAKRPEDRYASAASLAADLNRFSEGLEILARPTSPSRRVLRYVLRRPWLILILMLALMLLASLIAIVRLATIQASHDATGAERESGRHLAQQTKMCETYQLRVKCDSASKSSESMPSQFRAVIRAFHSNFPSTSGAFDRSGESAVGLPPSMYQPS